MMGDGDMEMQSEGKRLRRVACTCPNCKESGGRYTTLTRKFQIDWVRRCSPFNLLCLAEVREWGRRSSIYATSLAVARCTERRLTCEPTSAGTAVSDPLSATGCSAGRDSPGATSSRDTGGHTRVSGHWWSLRTSSNVFEATAGALL